MSIFNLLHLEPMLHTLASVWTLAGELVTAGALLWCLNALARFIRLVYDAGRWTGWFWRTYVVPAVLVSADFISWGVAQVDWVEVRRVFKLSFVHCAAVTVIVMRALRQFSIHLAAVSVLTVRAVRQFSNHGAAVTVLTVRTVVRIVRAAVQAVRFGVPAIYNWVEAHLIDVPQTDSHSLEDGLGRTARTVRVGVPTTSKKVEADPVKTPQTDCPVRTGRTGGYVPVLPYKSRLLYHWNKETEGGRYIERSIDLNEHPKSAVLRRRHGRLITV